MMVLWTTGLWPVFFRQRLAHLNFFGNLYNVNTTSSKIWKNNPNHYFQHHFSSDHPYESHFYLLFLRELKTLGFLMTVLRATNL